MSIYAKGCEGKITAFHWYTMQSRMYNVCFVKNAYKTAAQIVKILSINFTDKLTDVNAGVIVFFESNR